MACRFAPSPTGNIHIGNVRTLIYNYLAAKQFGLKLYLRIEDTDLVRSNFTYEQDIINTAKFFNINFDEFDSQPFIRQSDRFAIYQEYAQQLLQNGQAFYCECDKLPERFAKCNCRDSNLTSGVLRFKTPVDGSITYTDIVYGTITTPNNNIEDFALVREDGVPTYHFCVVVDDALMNITYVIRGEDHRNNTPKQLHLYRAFGWNIPQFAHLPLIVDQNGKKLSKRNGDTSIQNLVNEGYPSSGIFSFLLKLGFGYKDEEIFSRERALEVFDLHRVRKSPCFYNLSKLKYMSLFFLKTENIHKEKIWNLLHPKYPNISIELYDSIYEHIIVRCGTYKEFIANLSFLDDVDLDNENVIILKKNIVVNLIKNINEVEIWDLLNLQNIFQNMDKGLGSQHLRLILTNSDKSIPIIHVLVLLGKKITLERLERALCLLP